MKPRSDEPATATDAPPREPVLPLHEEELTVTTRRAETSVVRVETVTTTHDQRVDEPVARRRVEVERTEIGRYVDSVPDVRREGDVVIVPVVEEVVVVTQRRLLLREEVRIRLVRTVERHVETVPLRRQEAVVTRRPANESPAEQTSTDPTASTET